MWFTLVSNILSLCLISVLLLITRCNCAVFGGKKDKSVDDYILKFNRLDAEYPQPEHYMGKLTTRKINRTCTVFDVYHDVKTPLEKGKTKLKIQAYQFLSNTYRLTAVQLELDYCAILEAGSFGINDFSNNTESSSNYPGKCPVGPGKFLTKNGVLPSSAATYVNSVPPNFMGKWKVRLNYELSGKTMYVYNYYFELIRSAHYWKRTIPKSK